MISRQHIPAVAAMAAAPLSAASAIHLAGVRWDIAFSHAVVFAAGFTAGVAVNHVLHRHFA